MSITKRLRKSKHYDPNIKRRQLNAISEFIYEKKHEQLSKKRKKKMKYIQKHYKTDF